MKKLLLSALVLAALHAAGGRAGQLRVMSLNVRYPAERDGPNYWDLRRDLAVAAIRAPWKVLEVETMTFNQRGRYPSDHFPVFSLFDIQ